MANKKIILDAGHGFNTSGKRSPQSMGKVVREWTMNNAVCNYIQEILKDYNVIIVRTDDTTGKTDVPLSSRVSKTNAQNPNLFVSIHHNAGGGTGVETYYHTYGSSADKKIAQIVQSNLVKETGMRNRGVKQASFAVLTCKSSIPAILVEGGFYDNQTDFNYITSVNGQKAYARAVANSIIQYLGLTKKTPTTTTTTTSFKVGDKVVVKSSATTYADSTKIIPSWVKNGTYTVSKISGSKVLLKEITSWVNVSDVSKVSTTSTTTTTSYLVRVTVDSLNVRKSPTTSSAIVTTVKKGGVYTIVEVSNGFGRLKSNIGWISLDCTEKVK